MAAEIESLKATVAKLREKTTQLQSGTYQTLNKASKLPQRLVQGHHNSRGDK